MCCSISSVKSTARRERSAPLVAEFEAWIRTERARLSRHASVAPAMDYMLKRWDGFTCLLEDGRICLTNTAAERALRGIALGRRSWMFAVRLGAVLAKSREFIRYTNRQRIAAGTLRTKCAETHNALTADALLPGF